MGWWVSISWKKIRLLVLEFVNCFVQGSYRCLDPKFKTFSTTIIHFASLEVITKYVINRDVKKGRNKASRHSANARARLNKILLKRKKKFTYKALVVALKKKNNNKKNSRLCTIFPEFISISKLFPGLDNCWANFKTFSKIQHSTRTLFMNGKQSQPVRGTYVIQGYLILSCTLLKSRKSFASSVQLTFLRALLFIVSLWIY